MTGLLYVRLHATERRGFTLVEIMIVVAVIGLLAAIAIPNFTKARNNARVKACIANLRAIDSAKTNWALDNNKDGSVIPSQNDIVPYLSGQRMPICPGGGTYKIKRVEKNPSCTLYSIGHTLNNLNLDEDASAD
ncbi:MAG: prepilin-type N-terminal cleavage/methylation domain-containing protein [Verrucomicrobiota bacterium]|jgi:prepilin-type N-terminal cleavage/methylation domain-containing protein